MKSLKSLIGFTLIAIGLFSLIMVGCNKKNKPMHALLVPVLTTSEVINITAEKAESGGTITDNKGSLVIQRGVCWSTSVAPSINDFKTIDGVGAGNFTSIMGNLLPNTTYYVRAYATNTHGTGYGSTLSFTTKAPLPPVTDIDGNSYQTVLIGNQTWMAKNLKTTRFNDGQAIPLVEANTTWASESSSARCWYNNAEAQYSGVYGSMYNWYTVSTGKLCPTGWRVPNNADWDTLLTYLGGEAVAGGKLKDVISMHWDDPNTGATNESGFTGLPGGYRDAYQGAFSELNTRGWWWSSNEGALTANGFVVLCKHNLSNVIFDEANKRNGTYVRCIKD